MLSREYRHAAWSDRWLPLPGLVLTSAICCALLGLQTTDWRGSTNFASFVTNDRTTVAIVVQVLAHILGLIQVQALGATLRSSFMIAVSSRPFSIYLTQFIQHASIPRMTLDLPWFPACLLSVFVGLSLVPAALWSGALTPILSERVTGDAINAPTFAVLNTSDLWIGDNTTAVPGGGLLRTWMNDKGVFSFDPATIRPLVLSSASESSVANTSGSFHSKLDKSAYFYVGRSYGMGAASGLVDMSPHTNATWYTYNESGFLTRTKCAYNASMEFSVDSEGEKSFATVYTAHGETPDGYTAGGWSYFAYTPQDVFSWAVRYENTTRVAKIIMTTAARPDADEWGFVQFNATQCEISFEAHDFQVMVNNTGRIIQVNRTSTQPLPWPRHGDMVADQVANWIFHFSFVDAAAGGSQLGRSLRLNANQLQRATSDSSDTTFMRSIEDYLASCVDNVLIHLLSTRLVSGSKQATVTTPVTITVPAITFGGDSRYLYGVVVLNFLICMIYMIEMVRTRAWKGIHPLDFTSIRSVVLGLLRGDLLVEDASGLRIRRKYVDSDLNTQNEGYNNRRDSELDRNLMLRLSDNRFAQNAAGYSAVSLVTTHPKPIPSATITERDMELRVFDSTRTTSYVVDPDDVSLHPTRSQSTVDFVR